SMMENKDAFLYNRLELLKAESQDVFSDEFLVGLTDLSKKYPSANYTSYILFEMANFYLNKSANEDAKAFSEKKNWTEKALSVLNEIQTKFPKSAILKDAESLQKQILAPDFEIQIEKYVSPDLNTPMAVSHKNLDKLYFKVLKFNEDLKLALNRLPNDFEKYQQQNLNDALKKSMLIREFQLNLKNFDDYQQHSTLAKLDALKSGRYLILVSNNADFQLNENTELKYYNLDVTAYSIVFRNNEILVTERESGKPVSKKVNVYETKNNKESKLKTLKTNEFGLADINFSNDNYRYLKFKIDGEEVAYQNYYYRNYNNDKEETKTLTKFFTDRAIYRPGQTVYFKAIAYEETPDGKRKVLPNEEIGITLYDVNDEEISTLELKTNEFGSVSGEFVLP